ncbi:radical SAM family heme chaperone HemW [Salegentibacter salegens]|uniref:Heme chaperone HemW n=1 Tax=Salegentibacter salegens TaxID=143223 RepID=A0A1M7NCS2_9FLAO|nr:radical SAM family heme chaperone HemW [Salegentibacter salegens]PRX41566.1 oxygen-independent coproporphyrinogen-3 oxidase [Salegentibacter salegens]SHN01464.1 oxygen-independent coproporphyrinogen-3 oxidase [Salegentibacter salegens]
MKSPVQKKGVYELMKEIKILSEKLLYGIADNSSPSGRLGGAAGLYIHIPFCKQACHYCDFHFSTSLKKKGKLVEMLCRELLLRKDELNSPEIQTIYFGGGTPSLLEADELQQIFETIYANYKIAENPEITLEANPDDLTEEKLEMLKASKINRLSIGVQSFFEEDLKLMNRAHNAEEALKSIKLAKQSFDNISIDLIYGIPGMSLERWKRNLEISLELDVPHISSYALTVEPNTALQKFIERGKIKPVDDEAAKHHFEILVETLTKNGFEHYEFSNFGKSGYFSQNNTAYWLGKSYLGIGPAAHSYDGNSRKWNISNNPLYIKSLEKGEIPQETEDLSVSDKYNEYVMTRLRTKFGVDIAEVFQKFGENYKAHFAELAKPLQKENLIQEKNGIFHITSKGKFLSDGIAADLFFLE